MRPSTLCPKRLKPSDFRYTKVHPSATVRVKLCRLHFGFGPVQAPISLQIRGVVGVEVDGVDVEFGDETLEEEADIVGVVGLGGPDQLDWFVV